ncbi:hypothetical protein MH215_16875 [Paenibacillus sp. ACRSA]|uniref:hypothetical protein n=1 Tax=Paenibacillus sp. ACRSA TaxID=2918211 RepID=UPI001EF59802|nr:hypothetical protein [Paenibacillus sp. ACRSA]MCG7378683.1 hypothetical protein [Paenibacillus sp. ACRSA]
MIKLTRDGKYAMTIRFDLHGVNDLIEAFQNALNGAQGNIELDEPSMVGNKKLKKLTFSCNNELDQLSYDVSSLIFGLEDEVLEYNLGRLEECIESLHFAPAELCEVRFGKINMTIYGILENSYEEGM